MYSIKVLRKKDKIIISIVSVIVLATSILLCFFLIKKFYSPKNVEAAALIGKVEAAGRKSLATSESLNTRIKAPNNSTLYLPILLYHKTPNDFEEQMQKIKTTGHTPVTMEEATQIINKKIKGPSKPIAITFDDGFSDQLKAFEILKKYNYKSTFYIITGGKASDFCIGAEKDPSKTCGDSYMNWSEIINLSNSGLVEIGSHTVDHLQLTSIDQNLKKFQIFESKKIIENKIGKRVSSFAYPYGKYDQAAIKLVELAGYTNATTVVASEYQDSKNIMLLNRLRNTKDLR